MKTKKSTEINNGDTEFIISLFQFVIACMYDKFFYSKVSANHGPQVIIGQDFLDIHWVQIVSGFQLVQGLNFIIVCRVKQILEIRKIKKSLKLGKLNF